MTHPALQPHPFFHIQHFLQAQSHPLKTWVSPMRAEEETDSIRINSRLTTSMQDVKVCRGADIGSGNHLLKAKLKIHLKKQKTVKLVHPFPVDKLKDPVPVQHYKQPPSNQFQSLPHLSTADEQWKSFKTTATESAGHHPKENVVKERAVDSRQGDQPEKSNQDQKRPCRQGLLRRKKELLHTTKH